MSSHVNPAACFVIALVLLAMSVPARGQSASTDDATGATHFRHLDLDALPQALEMRPGVAPGENARPDRLFRAVSVSFLITASADLSSSMYHIGQGTAREVGFGAPWQDSPVAFTVTKSAMAAGFALALERLHKTKPKTAVVLGLAATALEGWLTVRNLQIPTR